MADVYLAHDLRHDRPVALKVLRGDIAAIVGRERFFAEISLTARLRHPHIIPLFDSGETDGLLYYVMPFIEGETLRARLEREGKLSIEEALRITSAISGALDYAHQLGVVHRDLKPENILLQNSVPMVADFGIALALSQTETQRRTQTGLSLGTPEYMSPEQAIAAGPTDARSDIYSLGVLLYEMLTGEVPYRGSNAAAVVAKILTDLPVRPRALRDTVPEPLDRAIMRALSKTPADRYESARAFAAAAETIPGRSIPRSRAIVAVVVALLAFLGFYLNRGSGDARGLAAAASGSVAVLPFESTDSLDTENKRLLDGMHTAVLTHLSKNPDLQVVGRASVLQFERSRKPLKQIGKELDVTSIVTGNFVRTGDTVRIDVQLLDPATGVMRWAQTFTAAHAPDQIFDVQTRIAEGISGVVTGTAARGSRNADANRPTSSMAAYDHYLKAESYFQKLLYREAMAEYEKAIALDSAFAHAWAGLASSASALHLIAQPEMRSLASHAFAVARRLAPDAAETHYARGRLLLYFDSDYEGAFEAFSRVRQLRPNDSEPLVWLSITLGFEFRFRESLQYLRQALRLDPLNVKVLWALGFAHAELWDFDKAKEYFDRGCLLAPDNVISQHQRFDVYLWGLGDIDGAEDLLPDTAPHLGSRTWIHFVRRDTAAMRQHLTRFRGRPYAWLTRLALLKGQRRWAAIYADSMRMNVQKRVAAADARQDLPIWVEELRARYAWASAVAGQRAEALAAADTALRRIDRQGDKLNDVMTHWSVALAYAHAGEAERAISMLRGILREGGGRNVTPVRLRLDPDLDPLRAEPGFRTLLREYEQTYTGRARSGADISPEH